MELIYLYIREYGNVFPKCEFNFSANYKVSFNLNKLMVEENKNSVKGYYGENVENVVLFLGENGTGKSTLLDILGMNRDDRSKDSIFYVSGWRKSKHSYFMLYHLYDDYYAFEFINEDFLEGEYKIENIDMQGISVREALYKVPMCCVFELKDNEFIYRDNIIYNWRTSNCIENKLEYTYVTSDKYNYRINNKEKYSYNPYMFDRNYCINENSYKHLYEYFVRLKALNEKLFEEKSIYINNVTSIDVYDDRETKDFEDFILLKQKELDENLGLISDYRLLRNYSFEENDIEGPKALFLKTLFVDAIEYYFLEYFVGYYTTENERINVLEPTWSVDLAENYINQLDDDSKWMCEEGTMDLMRFSEEYGLLLRKIKRNTNKDGIDFENILEYVLNRAEVAANNYVNAYDKEGFLKLVELLKKLPEEYFEGKRRIKIPCNIDRVDNDALELLNVYDYCFKVRNEEQGSNMIHNILRVGISAMSEGQRILLDIVSKCVNAIYNMNPGDSIVLLVDEPDRALHPELARNFLDILLDAINRCKDRKIQLILSSHSPFIVTDILPENVYSIELKDGIKKVANNNETYATNIYYLLMDSFMLKNTFGEYSYKKIREISKQLSNGADLMQNELKNIKSIIDRVGEEIVKNKLLGLYKLHDNTKENIAEQIRELDDAEKLQEIKRILEQND